MSTATATFKKVVNSWSGIRSYLHITDEASYNRSQKFLDYLLDEAGADERHPLSDLIDALGIAIEAYEDQHHQIPDVDEAELLRYFMEEHRLRQSDLPELGCQSVVSEILSGKRSLTADQMRRLGKRFHIDPGTFL
jgi:HTH-type transcriptional regulator/antitoxin HigA